MADTLNLPNDLNFLSVETSGDACSVALLHAGQLHLVEELQARQHTRALATLVEELLSASQLSLKDLHALVFSAGPGSFTGVRIACSFMQGLSLGLQCPIFPISSLRASAWHGYKLTQERQQLAILDARMSQVYWAQYIFEDERMQLLGLETVACQTDLPLNGWSRAMAVPKASDLLECALQDWRLGLRPEAREVGPNYVRHTVT